MEVDVLCVGHAAFDLTFVMDHHPGSDEKCSASDLIASGGGPAANGAVAVARLGGRAAFCGYLGQDLYGQLHFEELLAEGVRTDLIVRGLHPTPVSAVLVKPCGQRTVVNHRAKTPFLEEGTVDFSRCFPGAILFDGHEPLISLPLANFARAEGIPTVLDAGSVHRGTLELAPLVDFLVAAEKFARDLTGQRDMPRALHELTRLAGFVVITLGERGLIWSGGGIDGSMEALRVQAIDTTGAGDVFHGAFALGVSRCEDPVAAMNFATAAAALCCTKRGARPSIPTKDAVDVCIVEQGC